MSALTYAGKRFRLTVDNGVVFHNTYSPDGRSLHWEAVAGQTQGARLLDLREPGRTSGRTARRNPRDAVRTST